MTIYMQCLTQIFLVNKPVNWPTLIFNLLWRSQSSIHVNGLEQMFLDRSDTSMKPKLSKNKGVGSFAIGSPSMQCRISTFHRPSNIFRFMALIENINWTSQVPKSEDTYFETTPYFSKIWTSLNLNLSIYMNVRPSMKLFYSDIHIHSLSLFFIRRRSNSIRLQRTNFWHQSIKIWLANFD